MYGAVFLYIQKVTWFNVTIPAAITFTTAEHWIPSWELIKTTQLNLIFSRVSLSKDEAWIGNSIYWPLTGPTTINCNISKITVIITKSSNHKLSLHRPTSNSSSTTNFLWLSPTQNSLIRSVHCLQDNSSARTQRKTPCSFVKDACLQLRCLVIDVIFFSVFA
jgi:hypothetical protein